MASVGDTGPELELEEAEKMSESKIEATEQLKRVQAANEGMKLLLNSKLKESEDLFKKSRLVFCLIPCQSNSFSVISCCVYCRPF